MGLGGLLALLVISMLVAIVLVVGLQRGETRLNGGDVPYANAVSEAALNAKGIANDQRGFLLSGDATYIEEADRRVEDARRAFAAAESAAGNADQRRTIGAAHAGFEAWVQAIHGEFAAFQGGDHQRAVTASLGPDRELRKSYEQLLADAQALGDGSVRSASSSVDAAASRSILILVACLLVALAIGVGVAYWLMRSVAFPLFRLVALLTQDLPA
jgi:methyl-accepting chemotaxis protein